MDSVQLLRSSVDGKVALSPQVKSYIADEIERLISALHSIVRECSSPEHQTQCELAYVCEQTARHAIKLSLKGIGYGATKA